MTTNQVVIARGTLGARRCVGSLEHMWCSARGCKAEGAAVLQINIDGAWFYLCDACFDTLAGFVRES